jgi:hypothetical protein
MMSEPLYWLGVIGGIFFGWFAHSLCLQLAYKFGIVEYKGLKK